MSSEMLWQLVALWVSAFTSATILPGTSDVALLAVLNYNPQLWIITLIVATIGNSLGSILSYGMGRVLPQRKRPSPRIEAWLKKYGVWALLLAWLPIVGDGLPIAAGWLRLNFWLSCLMISIGKLGRYLFLALTYFSTVHFLLNP